MDYFMSFLCSMFYDLCLLIWYVFVDWICTLRTQLWLIAIGGGLVMVMVILGV